jgi:hypothetical protein
VRTRGKPVEVVRARGRLRRDIRTDVHAGESR